MKRLDRNIKIWLISSIISIVSGIISIAGAIIFSMKLMYVPIIICVVISAHGFYGAVAYLLNCLKLKDIKKIATEVDSGMTEISEISEKTAIKEKKVEKLIKKARKRGYIS